VAMNVTAKITRSGSWWAIEVPEVPGVYTQAKRLDQVDDTVREAVALMLEIKPSDIVLTGSFIDEPYEAELADARRRRDEAARAAQVAATATEAVVRRLHRAGYPTRDIGILLGLSHQRVAQILGKSPKAGRTKAAAEIRPARPTPSPKGGAARKPPKRDELPAIAAYAKLAAKASSGSSDARSKPSGKVVKDALRVQARSK
jgi:predicted RNase H-like HicB family nuclease